MPLSADSIAQLTTFIEKEGLVWAEAYIANRIASMRKRKMVARGDLVNSFAVEVSSALEGAVKTSIALSFEQHGRFIDMKRLNAPTGGRDYIEALEQWIADKGFQQKFISGFLATRPVKRVPVSILNQIAWVIAVKRTGKYRRRAWYSKSRAGAINQIYNTIAAGLPDVVAQEVKKAFSNNP